MYQARIIPEKDSSRLIIALEPEAASVYCRSLKDYSAGQKEPSRELQFKSGDKILIIDAGGN